MVGIPRARGDGRRAGRDAQASVGAPAAPGLAGDPAARPARGAAVAPDGEQAAETELHKEPTAAARTLRQTRPGGGNSPSLFRSMPWLPHLTPAARAPQHGAGTTRHTAIGAPETCTHADHDHWIRHFEYCWFLLRQLLRRRSVAWYDQTPLLVGPQPLEGADQRALRRTGRLQGIAGLPKLHVAIRA